MSGRSRWPSLVVAVVAATAIVGSRRPVPRPRNPARWLPRGVTPQLDTQVSFPTRTVRDADGDTLLADASGRAPGSTAPTWARRTTSPSRTSPTWVPPASPCSGCRSSEQARATQGGHDAAYLQHIEDVLAWAWIGTASR